MAIAIITKWLKDSYRDYNTGVTIFEQYSSSALLKALFKNGNSGYHMQRLMEALEELNNRLQESPSLQEFKVPEISEMPVTHKRYGVSDQKWDKLPPDIRHLYVKTSQLHRHSQMLFDQMKLVNTDEQRHLLSSQIVKERQELNDTWTTIKDFNEKGILVEKIVAAAEPLVNELPLTELLREKGNLPTYLSKDRKKAKDMADGPKKNKVLLRIEENSARLDLILKRLEGMK